MTAFIAILVTVAVIAILRALARRHEPAPRYQTFGRRFWAANLDTLVLLPVSLIDEYVSPILPGVVLQHMWHVAFSFAYPIYSVLAHGRWGQTVGKWMTGVRVLDVTGAPITYRQAIVRDSPLLAFTLAACLFESSRVVTSRDEGSAMTPFAWLLLALQFLWFSIELITMVTNSKRRAVHDFIAGTVVLRTDRKRSLKDRA